MSLIVDPMGAVIAGVHESAGFASARISMERQAYVRTILPCVSQRRYLLIDGNAEQFEVPNGVR